MPVGAAIKTITMKCSIVSCKMASRFEGGEDFRIVHMKDRSLKSTKVFNSISRYVNMFVVGSVYTINNATVGMYEEKKVIHMCVYVCVYLCLSIYVYERTFGVCVCVPVCVCVCACVCL